MLPAVPRCVWWVTWDVAETPTPLKWGWKARWVPQGIKGHQEASLRKIKPLGIPMVRLLSPLLSSKLNPIEVTAPQTTCNFINCHLPIELVKKQEKCSSDNQQTGNWMVIRYGLVRETCQKFGSNITWKIKRLWYWIYSMWTKHNTGNDIKHKLKVK